MKRRRDSEIVVVNSGKNEGRRKVNITERKYRCVKPSVVTLQRTHTYKYTIYNRI